MLGLGQAQEILNNLDFNLYTRRRGKSKNWRFLSWISVDGNNYSKPFSPQIPLEEIVDFAKTQLPVWDKKLLFAVGDVIEIDWRG